MHSLNNFVRTLLYHAHYLRETVFPDPSLQVSVPSPGTRMTEINSMRFSLDKPALPISWHYFISHPHVCMRYPPPTHTVSNFNDGMNSISLYYRRPVGHRWSTIISTCVFLIFQSFPKNIQVSYARRHLRGVSSLKSPNPVVPKYQKESIYAPGSFEVLSWWVVFLKFATEFLFIIY